MAKSASAAIDDEDNEPIGIRYLSLNAVMQLMDSGTYGIAIPIVAVPSKIQTVCTRGSYTDREFSNTGRSIEKTGIGYPGKFGLDLRIRSPGSFEQNGKGPEERLVVALDLVLVPFYWADGFPIQCFRFLGLPQLFVALADPDYSADSDRCATDQIQGHLFPGQTFDHVARERCGRIGLPASLGAPVSVACRSR